MAETTLYGIPHCDTVKKARRWLDEQNIAYVFHNFKKDGVPAEALASWVETLGLEKLVNRRGTTWRTLSDADKATIENGGDAASALLSAQSSMIKRPVLVTAEKTLIGFNPEEWSLAPISLPD